jgi:hypothetical protein
MHTFKNSCILVPVQNGSDRSMPNSRWSMQQIKMKARQHGLSGSGLFSVKIPLFYFECKFSGMQSTFRIPDRSPHHHRSARAKDPVGKLRRWLKYFLKSNVGTYLHTYLSVVWVWARYERGVSLPSTQHPPQVRTHRQFNPHLSLFSHNAFNTMTMVSASTYHSMIAVNIKYSLSWRKQLHRHRPSAHVSGPAFRCNTPFFTARL